MVLVVVVLGVNELLNLLNGQVDNDPILGSAVAQVLELNAVLLEPVVHKVVRLRCRPNKLIDFLGAQVLTVASMVRVGDYSR